MFGADDDKSFFGYSPVFQCVYHLSNRSIDKLDRVEEAGARRGGGIGVAAACEFLPDTDGLEVHAKQHRRAARACAGMIEAIYFVERGPNLDSVIPFRACNRPGEIRTRHGCGIRRRRKMEAELRVDQVDVGLAQVRV